MLGDGGGVGIDINNSIRHELLRITPELHQWILNEQAICNVLLSAQSVEDIMEVVVVGVDIDQARVWDAVQRKRKMLDDLDNILNSMDEVCSYELESPDDATFISVLRWRPNQRIFLAMNTRFSYGEYVHQFIGRMPSMWMYAVSHPETAACLSASGMSMLMHSVTTYAMRERFPAIHTLTINNPFAEMRAIFMRAAREDDFRITVDDFTGSVLVDLRTQHNYVNLWRKWIAHVACNNCMAQVRWSCVACAQQQHYCSHACAKEHWPIHSQFHY